MKKTLFLIFVAFPFFCVSQNRFEKALNEADSVVSAKLKLNEYKEAMNKITNDLKTHNMNKGQTVLVKVIKRGVIVDVLPHPFFPDWIAKPNYLVLYEGESEPVVVRKRDLRKISNEK